MGRIWGCVAVSVRSAPREALCTWRGAGAAPGAAGQSLGARMERTRAAVRELSPGPGKQDLKRIWSRVKTPQGPEVT